MQSHRHHHRIVRSGFAFAAIVLVAGALTSCTPPQVSISGHLTPPESVPNTNIEVAVYSATSETLLATTRTANGDFSFTVDELPFGTYRVRFADNSWWPSGSTWAEAQTITTTAQSPAIIDASVSMTGATIQGYGLIAGRPPTEFAASVVSADTDKFVASGTSYYGSLFNIVVPPGHYYLVAGGTWNGSLSHHDAVPFTVHDGDVFNYGAMDSPGPVTWSITGKVTDGTHPVSGAKVYFYEAEGHFIVRQVTTDAAGNFTANVNPSVELQAFVVDPTGTFQPVSWGATTLGGPDAATFSVPVNPAYGIVAIGTQVLTPAT